ncbi:hypothetical protein GR268_46230, partial [Rhizobium leguminosarum]|nr:hypothetical protein [Rhizobium leguminosarum]
PIQGEESSAETIGENDQIEGQVAIIGREAEKATELGKFEVLPIELVQEILFAVPYPAILSARQMNRAFYKLITGYDQAGLVVVSHRSNQIMRTDAWIINKEIDFTNNEKLSKLTPETIPSFTFYQLMGQVKNLPKEFWPYLEGTKVHT